MSSDDRLAQLERKIQHLTDRQEILATCSESEGVRFGRGHRHVFARLDPGKVLWFDQATGERLRPAA